MHLVKNETEYNRDQFELESRAFIALSFDRPRPIVWAFPKGAKTNISNRVNEPK